MAEVVLRASGLEKRFGETVAVDGIDLAIGAGEIFGLLGPNGAGKTTTVKMLITLYRPTAGTATILGHDVSTEPEQVRRVIGYVPQELTSDNYLTAHENLRLFANVYHLPKDRVRSRIDEVMRLVALEGVEGRLVKTFSGGMKKKLDLASGLLHDPKVLFLDEPSLGLDVQARRAVWEHVLHLKKKGVTILLCTNDMDEADRLCDRIAILYKGRVVALDTPSRLKDALGGDVITLECHGGENGAIDKLERAMRALDFVRDTKVANGSLLVYVQSNEKAIPRVMDAAKSAGVDIESLSYTRPHLDDVFLKHTGHRYRDSQEPPAPKGRRG